MNVKFNELKHAPIPAYPAELFDLDNFYFEPVQADHSASNPILHDDPGFDGAPTSISACTSTIHTSTSISACTSQTSEEQVSTSAVTNISSCAEIGSSLQRQTTEMNIPLQDELSGHKDHPLDKVLGDIGSGVMTGRQLSKFCFYTAFISKLEPKKNQDSLR